MPLVATQHTRGTLDADVQIASGESIRVHGIWVKNTSGGPGAIVFKRGDGTGDPILVMACNNNTSATFDGTWLADYGLSVDSLSDSNFEVTVFHSAGGV